MDARQQPYQTSSQGKLTNERKGVDPMTEKRPSVRGELESMTKLG